MCFFPVFETFFDHCGTVAVSWFARREAGCQSNVCQLAGFDSLRPMLSVSDVWYRYPYNEIYWCPHYLLTLLTVEFFSEKVDDKYQSLFILPSLIAPLHSAHLYKSFKRSLFAWKGHKTYHRAEEDPDKKGKVK